MNHIFSAVSVSDYTNPEFLVMEDNVLIRILNYKLYIYIYKIKINK